MVKKINIFNKIKVLGEYIRLIFYVGCIIALYDRSTKRMRIYEQLLRRVF